MWVIDSHSSPEILGLEILGVVLSSPTAYLFTYFTLSLANVVPRNYKIYSVHSNAAEGRSWMRECRYDVVISGIPEMPAIYML